MRGQENESRDGVKDYKGVQQLRCTFEGTQRGTNVDWWLNSKTHRSCQIHNKECHIRPWHPLWGELPILSFSSIWCFSKISVEFKHFFAWLWCKGRGTPTRKVFAGFCQFLRPKPLSTHLKTSLDHGGWKGEWAHQNLQCLQIKKSQCAQEKGKRTNNWLLGKRGLRSSRSTIYCR